MTVTAEFEYETLLRKETNRTGGKVPPHKLVNIHMPRCAARFARKFSATGAPSAAVPFWVHPVRAQGTSITVCTDEVSDVHLKCSNHSVDPRPSIQKVAFVLK